LFEPDTCLPCPHAHTHIYPSPHLCVCCFLWLCPHSITPRILPGWVGTPRCAPCAQVCLPPNTPITGLDCPVLVVVPCCAPTPALDVVPPHGSSHSLCCCACPFTFHWFLTLPWLFPLVSGLPCCLVWFITYLIVLGSGPDSGIVPFGQLGVPNSLTRSSDRRWAIAVSPWVRGGCPLPRLLPCALPTIVAHGPHCV